MNKRLIIIPLLSTMFAACDETTESHRFEGIWSAPAYGRIIKIEGDQYLQFEVTESSCLISESESGLSPEDYQSYLEVDAELQVLTDPGFNGVIDFHAPPVRYDRLQSLPEICEQPIPLADDPSYQHDPLRDFEIFWDTFNELYVSFENRGVDWYAQYQSGIKQLRPDISASEFFDILVAQIGPLKDAHVSIEAEDIGDIDFSNKPLIEEILIHEYTEENNISLPTGEEVKALIDDYIRDKLSLMENIVDSYADIPEAIKTAANNNLKWFNIGRVTYLEISLMAMFSNDPEDDALELDALENALDQVLADIQDSTGLIIDVRSNSGGSDFLSMAIASRFIDNPRHVFSKQARLGNDKTELIDVILEPRGSQQYLGPIVILTSASTESAAEIFTLMMSSLPNVTLIGEATQGVFSDRLGKTLPNGFEFSLSNEFYYDTAGNWYEGTGIPVDIEVPFFTPEQRTNEQDLGIEEAYSLLTDG